MEIFRGVAEKTAIIVVQGYLTNINILALRMPTASDGPISLNLPTINGLNIHWNLHRPPKPKNTKGPSTVKC